MKILTFFTCLIFFASANAQSPHWTWGKSPTVSSSGGDVVSISTDYLTNVYIGGAFYSPSIIFDTDTLSCPLARVEAFFAKYDSFGNLLWAKNANSLRGTNSHSGGGVYADNFRNVYFYGSYSDTMVLDNDTLISASLNVGSNIFIAKCDSLGHVNWIKSAGGSGGTADSPSSLLSDASGNIYVTGFSNSTNFTIGAFTFAHPSGSYVFIAKLDTAGTVLWAKCTGSPQANQGDGLAIDTFGNVYLIGVFSASYIVFNSDTIFHSGHGPDVFLAKFDSSGNTLWTKNICTSNGGSGDYVVTDAANNVYITIRDSDYSYLRKYDPSGNLIWSRADTGMYLEPINLATNKHDELYFSATNPGVDTVIIDTVVLVNHGMPGYFIVAFDTAGYALWGREIESGSWYPLSVATGPQGCIYAAGGFVRSPFVLDTIGLTASSPQNNIFVGKLCEPGVPLGVPGVNEGIETLLHPNPSTGRFQLGTMGAECLVTVTDMLGRQVWEMQKCTKPIVSIDISSQPGGVYFVRIQQGDKAVVKKVVVM